MSEKRNDHAESAHGPSEQQESLWLLTFAPATWATHLTLSYVTAAIWCAKIAGRDGSLFGARIAIGVYTLIALGVIALTAREALRKVNYGSGKSPHDEDTAGDRHRFLGFAAMLLCGLSAVATLYVAMSAVFVGSCR